MCSAHSRSRPIAVKTASEILVLAECVLATFIGTEVTNSELVMFMFCQQGSCITVMDNRILNVVAVKTDVKLVIETGKRSRIGFVTKSFTCTINLSCGVSAESW